MAGPRTCRNACGAPTNGSNTPEPIPAVSRTPTSALVSASGLPWRYTDEDLQRATKLALELFVKGQEHGQLQANSAPREQPLKTWFPDLYYRNLHLDCYCFCQQCEDHFETAGANKPNRVSFATSFLRGWSSDGTKKKHCSKAKDPMT